MGEESKARPELTRTKGRTGGPFYISSRSMGCLSDLLVGPEMEREEHAAHSCWAGMGLGLQQTSGPSWSDGIDGNC